MEENLVNNSATNKADEIALKRILPNPTWWPLSQYADDLEKKVDSLLHRVAQIGVFEAQRVLLELMQDNLVIMNLFLEAKFKGYKYLTKGARKRMYVNTWKIAKQFLEFAAKVEVNEDALETDLRRKGLVIPSMPSSPGVPGDMEKLKWWAIIMSFLKPDGTIDPQGKEHPPRYQYLEGASFGKLLVDLNRGQKMIGDCNQIVTFYVFLYSLRFPINDLQIKLPKNHVCIHYKGVDIEATNGSFTNYDEYEYILPVVELVSTNLLDVSDFRDKQLKVSSREFLKGSQLAYNISSQRELVSSNLKISYQNVAVEALKADDFETACFFLEKAGDEKLLADAYHNAVLYFVQHLNFTKARFYLSKSGDSELKRYVDEKEVVYFYDHGSLERARERFSAAGNLEMVKACYGKEYNSVQARVAGIKDLATMKSHRSDYQKLLDLAYKMDDQALVSNLQNILKQF